MIKCLILYFGGIVRKIHFTQSFEWPAVSALVQVTRMLCFDQSYEMTHTNCNCSEQESSTESFRSGLTAQQKQLCSHRLLCLAPLWQHRELILIECFDSLLWWHCLWLFSSHSKGWIVFVSTFVQVSCMLWMAPIDTIWKCSNARQRDRQI